MSEQHALILSLGDYDVLTTRSHGFIPISISPITIKFDGMIDQHAQIFPWIYDDITTTRSHDQR